MPYFVDFVDCCRLVEMLTITEPSIISLCIPNDRWNQVTQLVLVMDELKELRIGDRSLTHLHSFVLTALPKLETLFVGDGSFCIVDTQLLLRWRSIP